MSTYGSGREIKILRTERKIKRKIKIKKLLTYCDKMSILYRSRKAVTEYMQRYRSGHNEAVLKTVCPQGHVGSNPTLCALRKLVFLNTSFFVIYYGNTADSTIETMMW